METFSRYASKEMLDLWSEEKRIETWRDLWIALAEAQMEVGLTDYTGAPRITQKQIAEMKERNYVTPQQLNRAAIHERQCRHDVMAHIRAWGEHCPSAKGIIHLGATSCDITDNADLVIMRDSLYLIHAKLVSVIDAIAGFAEKFAAIPAVGFTHLQPAQLTTVGKRATLWCQDFCIAHDELERRIQTLRFRGVRGATGSQDSFLKLFWNDATKVKQLEKKVAEKMGFAETYPVTGQTYPRMIDTTILYALSLIGQAASKFGLDVRILQSRKEMEEPFEDDQVGSSAMPYKRNPMRSERVCGLSRYLINLCHNSEQTAASQMLERTLDDSSNRRLVLPQAFMCADGILKLCYNVANGLKIDVGNINMSLAKEVPFIATEGLMMEAVQRGEDRQKVHEIVRKETSLAIEQVRKGYVNNMVNRILGEKEFRHCGITTEPKKHIGRCVEQVEEFIKGCVNPIRERYSHLKGVVSDVTC